MQTFYLSENANLVQFTQIRLHNVIYGIAYNLQAAESLSYI